MPLLLLPWHVQDCAGTNVNGRTNVNKRRLDTTFRVAAHKLKGLTIAFCEPDLSLPAAGVYAEYDTLVTDFGQILRLMIRILMRS